MENLEESQSNSFELIDSNIKKVSDLKELVISLTSSPVKAPKPPQGEDEVSRPKQSTRNQEMKSKQISSNELLDQYISEEGGQKKPLLNEIATDTATGSIDTSDMLSYTTESMSDLEIIPTTNNQQGYSDRPTYDQMRSETGAISSNRDNSNRNNYYSSANDAGNSNWLDKMRNGDRYAERRKVTVPPVNKPVKKSSTNLNALKSKLALTSIDKVDERLEALKREKELLRMKLRTRIEDSIH